jgi:hypothetical protein
MSWPGNGCNTLENLGTLLVVVKVIHEAYRMNGDVIYGTHHEFLEREEGGLFCFLALRLVSRVNYSS